MVNNWLIIESLLFLLTYEALTPRCWVGSWWWMMVNLFEIRCFNVPRRPSCETVLASPVFPQMAPLDPDSTTTSCTNSATSQRWSWTAPGVPRTTPPATRSPATWTPAWSGGIPAAKMTSWFSWRYSLTLREDVMSLPPTKIRESN